MVEFVFDIEWFVGEFPVEGRLGLELEGAGEQRRLGVGPVIETSEQLLGPVPSWSVGELESEVALELEVDDEPLELDDDDEEEEEKEEEQEELLWTQTGSVAQAAGTAPRLPVLVGVVHAVGPLWPGSLLMVADEAGCSLLLH